jgi:hypothetical protein
MRNKKHPMGSEFEYENDKGEVLFFRLNQGKEIRIPAEYLTKITAVRLN